MSVYDMEIYCKGSGQTRRSFGLSLAESQDWLASFAYEHWDDDLLGVRTKNPVADFIAFFTKRRENFWYKYTQRKGEPADTPGVDPDIVELSPIELKLIRRALAAAHYDEVGVDLCRDKETFSKFRDSIRRKLT